MSILKDLLGCEEEQLKKYLELEKEKSDLFRKAFYEVENSYNKLLEITGEIIDLIKTEECNEEKIMQIIKQATKYNNRGLDGT